MTSTALGEFALEGIDIGPADEGVVADHGGDCAVDLALDGLILKLQICEGHRHRSSFLICAHEQPARRIAGIGAGRRDVPGHHRTRADHDIVGDAHRHDRGVGADRDAVADHGLAPQLLVAARRAAGRRRCR